MLCRRSSCGSCSDAVTLSPPSPGTAARGVSAGAVRNRGRGAACPGSCCPVRPRTPPDNGSRASRHRYRSSQHTFSLTPFKDSQMYKLYRRKWISSEKKTNQNKDTLIQHLTLLLLLRTPGRGIKSWRLTLQHPLPLQPTPHDAARCDRPQGNATHLHPSPNARQEQELACRDRAGGWDCSSCGCVQHGCSSADVRLLPSTRLQVAAAGWQRTGHLCVGSHGLLEKSLNSNDSDTKISCTAF